MDPERVQPGAFRGVIFDLDGTLTRPDAIDFPRMRRRIGMESPGSILAWIEQNAASEAEAESMRAVVWEEESAGADIRWFFAQWRRRRRNQRASATMAT